jgi:hypothetical protein
MNFGGNAMWGGLRGPVTGHGAGSSAASRSNGDGGPFAGIPPELEAPVTKLLRGEPEHARPTAVFTARNADRHPLTLRRILASRWRLGVTALALLALESAGYQTGPYLTQVRGAGHHRSDLPGNGRPDDPDRALPGAGLHPAGR